jgi:hypothetical protein
MTSTSNQKWLVPLKRDASSRALLAVTMAIRRAPFHIRPERGRSTGQ